MYPYVSPIKNGDFPASHVTISWGGGVRSQPPLAQVQDPAALEFETYKFNLAWTKMKQVVGGGGSEVAAAFLISQQMMVETPRNGPSHKKPPQAPRKNLMKTIRRDFFFGMGFMSLCYSFEEETPLCFFLQVRETT